MNVSCDFAAGEFEKSGPEEFRVFRSTAHQSRQRFKKCVQLEGQY